MRREDEPARDSARRTWRAHESDRNRSAAGHGTRLRRQGVPRSVRQSEARLGRHRSVAPALRVFRAGMSRQPVQQHDDEAAFVLHAYPYRETSLIVEAFTAGFGRVAMVARGGKRPRSEVRGLLQAFQPLALSWAGGGELKTLIKAEWRGGLALLNGSAVVCGVSLNALLLKLLAKEDAHPALFDDYAAALKALATESGAAAQATVLRRFEVRLLAAMGYAMQLTRDVDDAAIDPARLYHYAPDRGPRLVVA